MQPCLAPFAWSSRVCASQPAATKAHLPAAVAGVARASNARLMQRKLPFGNAHRHKAVAQRVQQQLRREDDALVLRQPVAPVVAAPEVDAHLAA